MMFSVCDFLWIFYLPTMEHQPDTTIWWIGT